MIKNNSLKRIVLTGTCCIILLYSLSVNILAQGVNKALNTKLGSPVLLAPSSGDTLNVIDTALVWQSVPGATSYHVQISTDGSFPYYVLPLIDTDCNDTLLSLKGYVGNKLLAGARYFWHVNAKNNSENSPYSTVWSFLFQDIFSKTLLDSLNSTFTWFLNNPPNADGSNFNARWNYSKLLDEYGYLISNTSWNSYRSNWSNESKSKNYEDTFPILYYLRQSCLNAYNEIRTTVVTKGARIWNIYNVGYIIKTKDKCFAIDLVARGSTQLIDILDFAIVTHIHTDHYDNNFVKAMTEKGKKVYAPFSANGTTVVSGTSEYNIGEINIRFTMSHQESDIPVIVPQINCGASAGGYTIYELADARPTISEINPTRHINLFIIDIQNSIDVFDAVDRVKPDATTYAHELELGHDIAEGWRWKYDYTYNKIKSQPHASNYVITWGESIEADSTVTEIKNGSSSIPKDFQLYQNYPNPFNPTTIISYRLAISSHVNLKVYDLLGKEETTLINEQQNAGDYSVIFDASSVRGGLPSGVYLYRLQAGNYSEMKKLVILK